MASLVAVDFVITGIFLIVSGRTGVLAWDTVLNFAILGAINSAGALLLFRPIRQFLRGEGEAEAARRRTARLAELSAAWAAFVTLLYCGAAFSLGVFWPEDAPFAELSASERIGGIVWFATVYTVYYAFYIYVLINDFLIDLKQRLWGMGVRVPPRNGWIAVKITLPLMVVVLIPNLLIVFDLTLFRDLRAAQGLSVTETIFLDLLASACLVGISLVFLTRGLLRPIGNLMPAIEASRSGELDTVVPVTSDDELGVLTERFNEMLEGLRERTFIRDTFGRYVPESVVAELVAGRGALQPTSTEATILFVDIEGFTTFAETRAPEVVLGMLNAYFAAAVEPLTRHGGVINQFQGDAILATFNVPVENPAHPDHAVQAAIDLLRVVTTRTFAGEAVRIRVGINTGPVIAGIVGSRDRQTYTVHSDAVNLAARLETLNKDLGTRILISGSTVARLSGAYDLKPRGSVLPRGSSRNIDVFELPPESVQ